MSATSSHPSRRDALNRLALRLAETSSAEAPRDELEDLQPAVDQLLKAGALIESSGQVRFAHESLRDFVYAEAFAGSGRSLRHYLHENGQDLSDRWLIRQVLGYLRGVDRSRYRAEVSELLRDDTLRFHVRDIVFETLRSDTSPSVEDWHVIEPFVVDDTSQSHRAAWSVVIRPEWFKLLDRMGTVIRWMASDDKATRDRATNLIRVAQRTASERAAILLAPFLGQETDWTARLRWIVGGVGGNPGRRYFDLLLDCVGQGLFDDGRVMQADELWMTAADLPTNEPDWAVELIDAYLRRGLEIAEPDGNPFDSDVLPNSEYWVQQFVGVTARHAPRSFVDAVFELVVEVAERTATPSLLGDAVRLGDPWEYRWSSAHGELKWALFYGLDDSLRSLARSKPRSLRPIAAARLMPHADIESIRYLLYRGWAANPGQFADDALDFLLREPAALICAAGDGPYGATRELIVAIQSVARAERLHELQSHIATFVPGWERTAAGRRAYRAAQWQLLGAFDEDRLSESARRLWRELSDKFGEHVEEPALPRTGTVGSPVSQHAATRMNDEQWLGAISKYNRENVRVVGASLQGGAIELSRVLEAETRSDPDRFAQLVLRLPDETHPAYVDAILRGLGDAERPVRAELLSAAVLHFFRMPGHPGAGSILHPLARAADQELPPEVMDVVVWWATQDPDPDTDTDNMESYYNAGSVVFPQGPLTAGINSVRGVAAQTLGALIWPSPERSKRLLPAVEAVAADPTLAVRSCAAYAVRSVLRHDVEAGLKLFVRLTDADDLLLVQGPVEELTGTVITKHRDASEVLRRMQEAEVPDVRQAAGRLSALDALFNSTAVEASEQAFERNGFVRRGIAEVAAANVGQADSQEQCERWLARLFYDDDHAVRAEASQWCRLVAGEQLGVLRHLVAVYIDSPAYTDDEHLLLAVLDDSPASMADLALRAVEIFVHHHAEKMTDISTRAAGTAITASRLAMRAYASSSTAEMRDRALDMIDRLLAAQVLEMDQLVQRYDPVVSS
jgi:hypothetical protein